MNQDQDRDRRADRGCARTHAPRATAMIRGVRRGGMSGDEPLRSPAPCLNFSRSPGRAGGAIGKAEPSPEFKVGQRPARPTHRRPFPGRLQTHQWGVWSGGGGAIGSIRSYCLRRLGIKFHTLRYRRLIPVVSHNSPLTLSCCVPHSVPPGRGQRSANMHESPTNAYASDT